uniref:Putative ovule protein n=1 Tax=Solanum chacoense TaxID=4108 RepID=A0A0V0HYM7_SOLCH
MELVEVREIWLGRHGHQRNGRVRGFKVHSQNILESPYLLYAANTLVLCDAEEEQINSLRLIFGDFSGSFWVPINWRKNHLFPVNMVPTAMSLA